MYNALLIISRRNKKVKSRTRVGVSVCICMCCVNLIISGISVKERDEDNVPKIK